VQSLQLVFGGRNLPLQGVAIYPQIENIAQLQKLTKSDAELIRKSWLNLRKLENISQIVNDQAVHEVPEGKALRMQMARFCGYESWSSLHRQMLLLCEKVDVLFKQLFETAEVVENLGQTEQQLLQVLLNELNLQRVPQDSVERVKLLLEQTVAKADKQVCFDFVALVRVILKRPSYLMMLLKEQNIHNHVLQLLEKDSYFKDVLVRFPVLLEQLFEHQTIGLVNADSLQASWQSNKQTEDVEAWMEQLRYFKWVHQFNAMRSLTDGLLSNKQLGQQLTQLATFILNQVVQFCWHEINEKYRDIQFAVNQLMVIAYGSMAVNRMTVNSDLDLVFVVDSAEMSANDRLFVQRWIKRIMHHLTSTMYHGHLYDIDLQLRPNGNSGTLMTSWDEFTKYQENEAWTWEHAAMVKSKLVVGTEAQRQKHQTFRKRILMRQRDFSLVDGDLSTMANKLQQINPNKPHGKDLALLGLVLKHAHQHPDLVAINDMSDLAKRLRELQLL
jgi:glutamate-ammonia-ligase adenylyltransferase